MHPPPDLADRLHGRLQSLQKRNSLRRLRGGREDGAAIVLHEPQPLRQVLRMIGAGILRDAKLRAQEG